MYIKSMHIENYRNLVDVYMTFHEQANYLVGENAIGKSVFLRLLSIMSNGCRIQEEDYADPAKPIVITMKLHMLDKGDEYFADTPDNI